MIILVTNFYNSLVMNKNIRDSNALLNPKSIFKNLSTFLDNDLVQALLAFNKYNSLIPAKELKTRNIFSNSKRIKICEIR
jgi:hypothetical protein